MGLSSPYSWKENPIKGDIPSEWHWGKVNGTNYLTQLKNQHIPQYCGSCWAQATTSALSDRIAIQRGGKFPEINISPQVLLSCDKSLNGCHGGDSLGAYQWMHDNDITDETCAPYQAKSWKEGMQCNATSLCMECFSSGPCFQPKSFNTYRVGEYARLPTNNQSAMMNEIFARGPIACSIFAEPIVNFTGDGVYMGNSTDNHDHVVSIVGWGTTADNVPYWHVRNSWGEYWGDQGYIKIYRGNNTLQIESNCVYGVPINTWQNQTYPHQAADTQKETQAVNILDKFQKLHEKAEVLYKYWVKQLKRHGCGIDYNKILMPVVTQPLPEHTVNVNSLPENFFWGDVDGVNYLSWTVNQHLPHYCGSCWAQAGVASITDRIRIKRNNQFPRVALSVQVLLNCVAEGTCNGGWGAGPFVFAHRHGIPEFGCQVYTASDPHVGEICTPIQKCKNCKPDAKETNCWAVENYKSWFISDHGSLRGADSIKKEVFARGPVACGMFATDKFEKTYSSGIYKERTLSPFPNHYISIVGWGKDPQTKEEYYIGRNSWGSHFGENGFFRISMREGSLGIGEYECFWGVPTISDTDQLSTA
jgi:cathepsin X